MAVKLESHDLRITCDWVARDESGRTIATYNPQEIQAARMQLGKVCGVKNWTDIEVVEADLKIRAALACRVFEEDAWDWVVDDEAVMQWRRDIRGNTLWPVIHEIVQDINRRKGASQHG